MDLALTDVAVIIFGVVAGPAASVIAGLCAVTAQVIFWMVVPLWVRHEPPRPV